MSALSLPAYPLLLMAVKLEPEQTDARPTSAATRKLAQDEDGIDDDDDSDSADDDATDDPA